MVIHPWHYDACDVSCDVIYYVIPVRARRMVRIFFLPYLGNRSKSDPCSYEFCLLRITHTIISQSIADYSWITLYLFQFSTCFEQPRAHHQDNQLYQYIWRPAHETVTDTEWHTPDVVLIQLILLMMSTWLLETRRELK